MVANRRLSISLSVPVSGFLSPYFMPDKGLLTNGTAMLIPVKIRRFAGISLGI